MSQTIQRFRAAFPNVQISDEALTEALYDNSRGNPIFDNDPEFVSEALAIKRARRPGIVEQFGRDVERGVSQLKAMGYGAGAAAADALGLQSFSDRLLEGYQETTQRMAEENPPTISTFRNIRTVGDAARYGVEALGENLPVMIPSLASGGIGALLGRRLAQRAVTGLAAEEASKLAAKRVAQGAAAGAYAPSAAMETGSVYADIAEKTGERRPGVAMAAGAAAGALDVAPSALLLTRLMGPAGAGAVRRGLARRIGAGAAEQFLSEAPTEGLQTIIERAAVQYADPRHGTFSPEGVDEIVDAMLKGGLAGAAIGGASGISNVEFRMSSEGQKAPVTKLDPVIEAKVSSVTPERRRDIEEMKGREVRGEETREDIAAKRTLTPEEQIYETVATPVGAVGSNQGAVISDQGSTQADLRGELDLLRQVIEEQRAAITERDMRQGLDALDALQAEHDAREKAAKESQASGVVERARKFQVMRDLADLDDTIAQVRGMIEQRNKIAKAEAAVETNPTEAQKESGNYRKGHVTVDGFDIAIENPVGSERSGVDKGGKAWTVRMPASYGYLKRTEGKDGDAVDVYLGPQPEAGTVYVVDQKDLESGKFDEHKTLMGFPDEASALAAYDAAFSDGKGPERRMGVTALTKEEFREWLKDGETGKPMAEGVGDSKSESDGTPPGEGTGPTESGPNPSTLDPDAFVASLDIAGGVTEATGSPVDTQLVDTSRPGNVEALGRQLVKAARANEKGRGAANNDKGFTRRAVALQDNDTGNIIVAGVYDNRGVKVVDPQGGGRGVALSEVLARRSKVQTGEARYTPVVSLRFGEARKGYSETFTGEQWAKIQEAAQNRLAAEVGRAPKMQGRGVSESEGQEFELATEDSYTPVDLEAEFRDVVIEALPKQSNLSRDQVRGALLEALEADENADVRNYVLREAAAELMDRPEFARLDLKQKQQALINYITDEVFQKYQAGSYADSPGGIQALAAAVEGRAVREQGSQGGAGNEVASAAAEVGDRGEGIGAMTEPGGGTRPTGLGPNPLALVPKFRDGRSLISPEVSAKQYADVLARLRAAGVDVRLFQEGMERRLGVSLRSGGGFFDPTQRVIGLVVKDASAPSREEMTAALHELAHYLFSNENSDRRAAILRAIDRVSDETLGLQASTDPRILSSNPDNLAWDALAEERLVESLALEGVPLAEARGMGRRIVDFLRQVYEAVAMAVQYGLFGEVNPEMARSYMRRRMRDFLTGTAQGRAEFGVVDFFGGRTRTDTDMAETMPLSGGESAIPSYYDADRGETLYPELLPATAEAMRFNLRTAKFRKPGDVNAPREVSPDQTSAVKFADIAAQNAVDRVLREVFADQERRGKNRTSTGDPVFDLDGFTEWALPDKMEAPRAVVAAANEALDRAGLRPVNPELAIEDLNEFARKEASHKALMLLRRVKADWAARRSEAERAVSGKPGSLKAKLEKSGSRLLRLTEEYTDADFMFAEAKQSIDALLREMRDDLKDVRNEARKAGAAAQALREIEGEMDAPMARQYAGVINKLADRISKDRTTQQKFSQMLEYLASQSQVPWAEMSLAESREIIQAAAERYELLSPLARGTREANALLAITAAFARSNALMMRLMELRRTDAATERARVNELLKQAMASGSEDLQDLRTEAKKLPRLAVLADRLLTQVREEKRRNQQLRDAIRREAEWIEFHHDALPIMDTRMAELENRLGAVDLIFEAKEGEGYYVPGTRDEGRGTSTEPGEGTGPTGDGAAGMVKRTFHLERDGRMAAQVKEDVRKMEEWLGGITPDSPLYGSAIHRRIAIQAEKLRENQMAAEHQIGRRSLTNKIFGSMVDQLKMIGHPAAQSLARRMIRYTDFMHRFRNDVETASVRWANAEADAMRRLGYSGERRDVFRELFYDRGLKYIEERKDLLAEGMSLDEAQRQALDGTRAYLAGDPDTAQAMQRPGAWEALKKYYLATAAASDMLVKIGQQMGIKIEDDALGLFRDTKGAPLFETMRRVNGGLRFVYERMRPAWTAGISNVEFRMSSGRQETPGGGTGPTGVAAEYSENPDALRARLEPLFTPEVWRDFARPLAYRPGRAVFYAPADEAGHFQLAPRENVIRAFEDARGDAVAFAERLYDLSEGKTDRGEFVAETLDTFQNFFNNLHSLFQEQSASQFRNMEPVGHLLMDARRSEEFPPEWLEYRAYDGHQARLLLHQLAQHAAFGRDLSGAVSDLEAGKVGLERALQGVRDEGRGVMGETPGHGTRPTREEAAKVGKIISDQDTLRRVEGNFKAFVESQAGIPREARAFSELMSTAVAMAVQGPATAFIDTLSLFKPIQELGLSRTALRQVAANLSSAAAENLGSIAQIFGRSVKWNADNARLRNELGIYDTDNELTLKEKLRAAWHSVEQREGAGILERAGNAITAGARGARTLLNTGIGAGGDGRGLRTTFKPLAPFTQIGRTMHAATIDGVWRTYEDAVLRAVAFFRSNPEAMADPDFQFKARDLGYGKSFFGLLDDEKAFEALNADLSDYGRWSLEDLARDYIARVASGSPPRGGTRPTGVDLLTPEIRQRLAVMAQNKITMEGSIASRPAALITNPVLHYALPLVGWSIAQVESVARSFRDPAGQRDLKKGVKAFAALSGVALAYSLMKDWYDEDVLGKAGNVLPLGGERKTLAVIDRLARMGQLGIVGDALNSMVNTDTARDFSIDSRVFAVSSFLNLLRTAGAWHRQGEATWATVGRPMAQALGGSGYLQYWEALNNALSLDNAEARATARINVNNLLRVAGRELNLDVRTGKGQMTLPTRMKPWITEMALAAYANDPAGFREAHQRALAAAKADGRSDPEESVKRAFTNQHPLRNVFQSAPTSGQYRQILSTLDDGARGAVTEAVSLFNRYGERIGVRPYEGRGEGRGVMGETPGHGTRPTGAEDVRRRAFEMMRRESLFAE